MPSVLFLYIVVLYSVWRKSHEPSLYSFATVFFILIALCILINLLSGRTLVCSDDDLIKSLQQPSAYCVISGPILYMFIMCKYTLINTAIKNNISKILSIRVSTFYLMYLLLCTWNYVRNH